MNIPPYLSSLVMFALAVLAAKRVLDAIRGESIGFGSSAPIYVERRKNPFAFWFFVGLFAFFSLGFAAVSIYLAQGMLFGA
jgi:hypothetical protein